MIIKKRVNYKKAEPEKISAVDVVDRTGYIPLELQYERLMSAGATLERQYTQQYMFQYADVVDALENNNLYSMLRSVDYRGGKHTPQELHDMYLDKFNRKKNYDANVKKLNDNYNKWLEEKEVINNKINEYKLQQENNLKVNE